MFWCLSTDIYHGKPLTNNVKANKVLRRIKQNPLVIRFPNHGEVDQLQLQCYSDASLANLSSRNSAEGHVIFLVGQNSNVCPLSSRTKTLRCVARGTLSAETSDMSNALEITYFLTNVLSEILFLKSEFHKMPDNRVPILVFTDSEFLYRTVHSTVMTNEHRLQICFA